MHDLRFVFDKVRRPSKDFETIMLLLRKCSSTTISDELWACAVERAFWIHMQHNPESSILLLLLSSPHNSSRNKNEQGRSVCTPQHARQGRRLLVSSLSCYHGK